MSTQVETLEHNMVKVTIEATAKELDAALDRAYQKTRNQITIPGFRKGKATRKMVEKLYGAQVFYEDAANDLIPAKYEEFMNETELDIVSQPKIDVVTLEEGQPFVFTAEVAVKPEVTLGAYMGVEVAKADVKVTDEEVQAEIDRERENQSRTITVEDRPVEDQDIVTIDFEGYVDGETFEGGSAKDHSLTIGSHSFIDNFEEQLIGVSIGEEKDVHVTFPEEYHAKELAGKPALFKVTVKGIKYKELPEVDDEFAQEVSEFDTLEEYKEDVKRNLLERKQEQAKVEKQDAVVEKIIEGAEMDIPQPMIDFQARNMMDDMASRMQQQGITMEQYLQMMGQTPAQMLEQMQPQALKRIQSRLVLEQIVKQENIEVSDERFEEEVEKLGKTYNIEPDKVKELMGEEQLDQMKKDIAIQLAVEKVADAAKEVE